MLSFLNVFYFHTPHSSSINIIHSARFEVPKMVLLKIQAFCNTLCHWVSSSEYFKGPSAPEDADTTILSYNKNRSHHNTMIHPRIFEYSSPKISATTSTQFDFRHALNKLKFSTLKTTL
jgi:hypothetical protein